MFTLCWSWQRDNDSDFEFFEQVFDFAIFLFLSSPPPDELQRALAPRGPHTTSGTQGEQATGFDRKPKKEEEEVVEEEEDEMMKKERGLEEEEKKRREIQNGRCWMMADRETGWAGACDRA